MRRFLRAQLVLVVILGMIVLHIIGWLKPLERGFASLLRPVQNFFASLTSRTSARTGDATNKRIQELETQLSRLMTENILLKNQLLDEKEQRLQQTFLERYHLTGTTSSVIGRSPEGEQFIMVLDKGSDHGIAKGQPVIADEGILIGTIISAEMGRSFVLLLSDTRSIVAAEVLNDAQSSGLVSGQHGLTMEMNFIPQNDILENNQLVVTSTLNSHIPPNLLIGTVSSIYQKKGEVFQNATLTPPKDYRIIRTVTVIQS
jgi:rod shape-determining protein MreC